MRYDGYQQQHNGCYHPHCPTCSPRETEPRMGGLATLSIQAQMGTDPTSKLAAAIEKLADVLKAEGNRD